MNSCEKGRAAEEVAVNYLISEGYTVLDRNFRYSGGEIDIIGTKEDVIVFFEVKTVQKREFEQVEYIVNRLKQRKIIQTSKRFLHRYPDYNNRPVRYDLLCYEQPSGIYSHLENAFYEDGIG